MDAGPATSENPNVAGIAPQPVAPEMYMEVDAGDAASEELSGGGVVFQPDVSEIVEKSSVTPQTRLDPRWCKNSEAREFLGMGVGRDEQYKEFQDFCRKVIEELGIAYKGNTSPEVWDQFLESVLALDMMAPYTELYRAVDKSLESRNAKIAINHLLRVNAKTSGKRKKVEATKARVVDVVTPRANAHPRPAPANSAIPAGTKAARTSNLNALEFERKRVQHHRVKALRYKNKYLVQVLENERIKAKYTRARYHKLKQKHIDLQQRYNRLQCQNHPMNKYQGSQSQDSTERTTNNGDVSRSEMDLELLRLAGLEDGYQEKQPAAE
ncbi:hypothetical protein RUND412_003229 [Rhizina undulata]